MLWDAGWALRHWRSCLIAFWNSWPWVNSSAAYNMHNARSLWLVDVVDMQEIPKNGLISVNSLLISLWIRKNLICDMNDSLDRLFHHNFEHSINDCWFLSVWLIIHTFENNMVLLHKETQNSFFVILAKQRTSTKVILPCSTGQIPGVDDGAPQADTQVTVLWTAGYVHRHAPYSPHHPGCECTAASLHSSHSLGCFPPETS